MFLTGGYDSLGVKTRYLGGETVTARIPMAETSCALTHGLKIWANPIHDRVHHLPHDHEMTRVARPLIPVTR